MICQVYVAGSRFHPEYKDLNDFDTTNMTLHFPSGALVRSTRKYF